MDVELLRRRSGIIRKTREFFDKAGYLELDTPALSPDLIPESCLEVFKTTRILPAEAGGNVARNNGDLFLIPSPEIYMKKVIAGARVDVFQICKCFRNGEQEGRYHSPEFTMLEYYTVGADYMDSLAITERLFAALYQAFPDAPRQAAPPFVRMTMEAAFIRYAHFSLEEALADGSLREKAAALGIDAPPDAGDGVVYNLVFIHAVEPKLAREGPVALLDYPAIVPCLAKALPQKSACKQRWELYAGGVELANCYTEETKAEEVRAFFVSEAAEKKAHGLVAHTVDVDYWKMFLPVAGTDGDVLRYPECSGVALGMDRLIMLLCGKPDIAGVLPCAHAND